MMMTVRIKMDNEAFGDNAGSEAARILRELADRVNDNPCVKRNYISVLFDENGNEVVNMDAKHTPTPWVIHRFDCTIHKTCPGHADIIGADLSTVTQASPIDPANALFIVRAANAHDGLVRILTAINDFWSDVAVNQKGGACLSPSALLLDDDTPIAVAVSAALAKARGE